MVLKVNAGLFFRAEGGAAAAFGSKQGEGLPNITGSETGFGAAEDYTSFSGCFYGGPKYTGLAGGHSEGANSVNVYFNASRSSAIYGASSHVTPVNSTIRVWKRTA